MTRYYEIDFTMKVIWGIILMLFSIAFMICTFKPPMWILAGIMIIFALLLFIYDDIRGYNNSTRTIERINRRLAGRQELIEYDKSDLLGPFGSKYLITQLDQDLVDVDVEDIPSFSFDLTIDTTDKDFDNIA